MTAYSQRIKERNVMTENDLRTVAPSVFSDAPRGDVSSRYAFVPTIDVISRVREAGFIPVQAGQSRARGADRSTFTKHMVRFRHEADFGSTKELTPEILLINSHDRSSAFSLQAGIFRLVCSNGLIVMDQSYGKFSFRHSGDAADRIVESTSAVAEIAKRAIERAQEMSKIVITVDQQLALARAAAALRYKDSSDETIVNGILVPKRAIEQNPGRVDLPKGDLFTTINVLQENIMLGKIQRTLKSGRKSSTHAVNSVQADLAINKGIWNLAEKFALEVA